MILFRCHESAPSALGFAKSSGLVLELALPGSRFVENRIVDDPGILGAAALAGIDDERILDQGDPRQTAGHDADAIRAGENEGPQIDVAGRDAGVEKSRRGG
jgi:hypothetical protein